jgi:ubiquinone/menaquinone biosynthesis C-methylase UbiE
MMRMSPLRTEPSRTVPQPTRTLIQAEIDAAMRRNDDRLNRSIRWFDGILLKLNLWITRLRGPMACPSLEARRIVAANRAFAGLFSQHLEEMIHQASQDPEGYQQKITSYETRLADRPQVPFDTDNRFYRLIVRDPLRIREEHFLFRAIIANGLLDDERFAALDLGTGNGRLAFCMAELLSRACAQPDYEICGLDLSPNNIRDALELNVAGGLKDCLRFVTGDMTRLPFEANRFSLCNSASSLYLVPFYTRALALLEMIRVLKTGGEGVITGPNENFSVKDYAACMAASNRETYLHPVNMVLAQRLGPIGLLIDEISRRRLDFSFPDTEQTCRALKMAGCEVLKVEKWPRSCLAAVYSGIHFRKTRRSDTLIQTYIDFADRRIQSSALTAI